MAETATLDAAQDGPTTEVPGQVRRRRRWVVVVACLSITFSVLVLLPAALLGVAWARVSELELTPTSIDGGTETIAIVGLDTRAPALRSGSAKDAAMFPDAEAVKGSRADVIVLLRLGDGDPQVMTVSRDLLVFNDRGRLERVSLGWLDSPQTLVNSLCRVGPGLPVDHVIAVDYRAVVSLIDAAGGMTVETPVSERDKRAHLRATNPGTNQLDGAQALAWVRSRHAEELTANGWQPARTGQAQRSVRALTPLHTVADSLPARAPWVLAALPGVGSATQADPGLGIGGMRRILGAMSTRPDATELDVRVTDGPIPFARLGPRAGAQVREFNGSDRCATDSRLVTK